MSEADKPNETAPSHAPDRLPDRSRDSTRCHNFATPTLHLVLVSHLDELLPLKDDWNRLARDVPFRRLEWLGNWWRHFGGETTARPSRRQLFVLLVYDSPLRRQLLGIAPWFVERKPVKGRTIRFLGSGEVCSDYLSILCEPRYEKPLAAALAAWLHQRESGLWDSIELSSFAPDDVVARELVEQLRQAGHAAVSWSDCRCWRIALPRTWDAFQSRLSKSHRKQLRRLERRWFDTGRAKLSTVDSADEAAAALHKLAELHQRRRWSLGDRGCFDSPPFVGFLSEATRELFEAGVLRLHLLKLDGRVAAADYNLLADGVLFAYQGGIDPDRLGTEPGNLLTLATIRQAIDEGLDHYDLLRGDEPYKLHWRAEPLSLVEARVFGLSRAARARKFLWLARRKLFRAAKQALRCVSRRLADAPKQEIRADAAQPLNRPSALRLAGVLTVRTHSTTAEMAQLESQWDRLAEGVVFRQFEWLASWWNQFGEKRHGQAERRLFVVSVADEAGDIIGVAPWYIERTIAQGRVIRFLGDGVACSDYLSILHRDSQRVRVATALADWLIGPSSPPWERIELTGVAAEDPIMSALGERFGQRGFAVHTSQGANCWRTPLAEKWDGCVAKLPRSMRTKVRQIQKRYLDTGRAKLFVATSAEELAAGFEVFAMLHQKRRTAAGDPGCFSDPVFATFLRDMAERFFDRGQLELSWIELDGRPIASSFNLLGRQTSYFYQSGIEPEALQYSPGHMMHMACIQAALARGDTAYDFLRGDEPYKQLWAAEPVPCVEYRIIANRFSAVVRHCAWIGRRQVRRAAKQGLTAFCQWQRTAMAACKAIFSKKSGHSVGGTGA